MFIKGLTKESNFPKHIIVFRLGSLTHKQLQKQLEEAAICV